MDALAMNAIQGKYEPVPESGCWLWTKQWGTFGYGVQHFCGRKVGAHRLSYMAHKGDPGNMHVCHKCDTPACINPDHLFLGTAADNIRDMRQKGRARVGEGFIKSHCIHGHPYEEGNIYLVLIGGTYLARRCKTCIKERSKRYYKNRSQQT